MPDQNPTKESKPLSRAEAAKLVKRTVPVLDKKGQPELNENDEPITKQKSISEKEILNFADYEDRVVVVTTSGEKLVHNK